MAWVKVGGVNQGSDIKDEVLDAIRPYFKLLFADFMEELRKLRFQKEWYIRILITIFPTLILSLIFGERTIKSILSSFYLEESIWAYYMLLCLLILLFAGVVCVWKLTKLRELEREHDSKWMMFVHLYHDRYLLEGASCFSEIKKSQSRSS
ncbi:hypothetical protein [Cohnella soli]|uniref:DUF2663 family protein n=1 Tax=Cohnella soli TaxID=425005 RepID=A0ABW0HTA4_9BACL